MEVAELREWSRPATLAGERTLPVLPALAPVLPSGLRRGAIVGVSGPGATSVALALLAGPSRAGSWVAVVGLPDLGVAAADEAGMDLSRLALVPHPGDRGPVVAATLVDGLDVVVVGPGAGIGPADARRLAARTRQRGAVLVAAARPWSERCDIELSVAASAWVGLERGCGHLSRRLLEVEGGGTGGGPGCGCPPGRAPLCRGSPGPRQKRRTV